MRLLHFLLFKMLVDDGLCFVQGIIKERLEEMLARAYETSSGAVSLTKKLPQNNINDSVHLGSGEQTEVLYKTSDNTTTNTHSRSRSSGTGQKNAVSSNPESLISGCSVSGGDSEDALAVSQCITMRPNNSQLEGCAGGGLVESCVDEIPHTSYNQSGEFVSTVFGGVRLKGVSDCNLPAGELKSIALKIPPVPLSYSPKSGCRPIHLDGGVREESVNDIEVSEWLNGFSVLPSPPVAFGSHGQHGCGSEKDATPMVAPSRQPVMSGVSESLLTWSCGRSVKSVNGAIVQVFLLDNFGDGYACVGFVVAGSHVSSSCLWLMCVKMFYWVVTADCCTVW